MTTKTKLAAIALIALLGTVGAVYAATQLIIPTTGTITTGAITASVVALDWGNLTLGAQATRVFTLTNTSPTNATRPLNLTAPTTIGTVTWSAEGLPIAAGQALAVTVTLTVYQNASAGPFEFPIYITG